MSGRSRSLATTVFFEAEPLSMDEVPHRSIIDLKPALGQLGHQPAQSESAFPNAPRQKNRMLACDRLGLVPAHLARRHAARFLKAPDPIDHRARRDAKLRRRLMSRPTTLQNRRNRTLPNVRIRPSHPCWPPPSQKVESEQRRFGNPLFDSAQIHPASRITRAAVNGHLLIVRPT